MLDVVSYLMGHKAGEKSAPPPLIKSVIKWAGETSLTVNASSGEDLSVYSHAIAALRPTATFPATDVNLSDYADKDLVTYIIYNTPKSADRAYIHNAESVKSDVASWGQDYSGAVYDADKVTLDAGVGCVFADANYDVILWK